MPKISLPYFDILLNEISHGKRDIATAFGRHVHWGYWDDDNRGDGSMSDFARAADRMSERVWRAAGAAPGQKILDVGCGFGGTLATIDEAMEGVDLVGLNIDPRQLERAREIVRPKSENKLTFVEGDACDMPFADGTFDVVLAVECAFHFPSRTRFFSEARRVLKPGGRLALCDIIPSEGGARFVALHDMFWRNYSERLAGRCDISCTADGYKKLGRDAGFRLLVEENVTKNTIPTYKVLRHIIRETGIHVGTALWGTGAMELLGRLDVLRYLIMSFDKPAEVEARISGRPPRDTSREQRVAVATDGI